MTVKVHGKRLELAESGHLFERHGAKAKRMWFALRRKGILRTQTWNDKHGQNSRGFLLPHRLWYDRDKKQNTVHRGEV